MELLVPRPGIADAVGRDERQAQPPRELHERLVAVLLFTEAVAAELDVESSRKETGEAAEHFPRRVESFALERSRDRPFLSARQAVKPLGVRGDLLPGHRRLPLRLSRRALGDQATEVLVPGPVLDEESEIRGDEV